MKAFLNKNELFIRLLMMFITCIAMASTLVLLITYNRSKETYIASYRNSNQLLMRKIQDDYEYLHENINSIFQIVSKSTATVNYLKNKEVDGKTILKLNEEMQDTRFVTADIPSNLILLGENGQTFFQNEGVRSIEIEELLAGELVQKINSSENLTQMYFMENGLTTATKSSPGLLFVHKLQDANEQYGYALIFITEANFASIFHSLFDTTLHKTFVVNNETNQIVSSNRKELVGEKFLSEKENKGFYSNQMNLYSFNYRLYDVIDENILVRKMNVIQPMLIITVAGIFLVSIFAFFIIRQLTKPLYQLIDELPSVIDDGFSNQVKLKGTYEVEELGRSYNLMLKRLQEYFDQLLKTENAKRLAEIRSLQMQIQPHFIYNTLTSIKFLIFQNENEKAITALDHFIKLLRHSLRNSNEVVTLADEIKGLKAYTEILRLRYGDNIQMNYFVSDEASNCLVPKMIVQPIIENSYLHAFPTQEEGFIQLFATMREGDLIIEIMDNGIGFKPETELAGKTSKLNYSGIGLKNINERIQLLYGNRYGLTIQSDESLGTTIMIRLPKK